MEVAVKRSKFQKKRARAGVLFILPWLIGVALFFLQTILNLMRYSLCDAKIVQGKGYVFESLENGIFTHYINAFVRDSLFPQKLAESLSDMIYRIPVILVFSLVVAIILNQKFKGRGMMRAVFFVPLLISSGVIASIIKGSLTSTVMGAESSNNIFNAALLTNMLYEVGLPNQLVTTIGSFVSNVTDLVWGSSVQIIVFIMGLMTIPASFYEVAQVEGATGWETFWRVTFPSVSPYILVNLIYTAIDHFVSYDNVMMKYIMDSAYKDFKFSYAAAMSWIYFIIIIVALLVMVFMVSLVTPFFEKKEKVRRKKG